MDSGRKLLVGLTGSAPNINTSPDKGANGLIFEVRANIVNKVIDNFQNSSLNYRFITHNNEAYEQTTIREGVSL